MGTKNGNIPLTAQEQAEHDAAQATAQADSAARATVIAQKATDKASAKVKLQAAEYTPLTEAETDTIVI